jgi:hypothetical protein
MSLAAQDLLVRIITPNSTAWSLDWLTVDNRCAGLFLSALILPVQHQRDIMNHFKQQSPYKTPEPTVQWLSGEESALSTYTVLLQSAPGNEWH